MNSTPRSYLQSVSLHAIIVFAAALMAYVANFYPQEDPSEKLVMDLVEPAQQNSEPLLPPPPSPQINVEPLPQVQPLEIPPAPTPPEPTPPEPTPAPPEPTPKPTPKPKPVDVPKPKPKPMTAEEFFKQNPQKTKPTVTAPKPSKPVNLKPVEVGSNISVNATSFSNVKTNQSSSAVRQAQMDAFQAYLRYINAQAKAKWRLPSSCQGIDFVATIEFKISKSGMVSNVVITKSSGNKDFDNSVIAVFSSLVLSGTPDNESHVISLNFRTE